jgi:hypothetical protein
VQAMADPSGPYELLPGRGTYDAHGPHVKDDLVADQLNRARKHVASRTRGHPMALVPFSENGPELADERGGGTRAHRHESTARRLEGEVDASPPGSST